MLSLKLNLAPGPCGGNSPRSSDDSSSRGIKKKKQINKTHASETLTGSFDEAPLVLVRHERRRQHSADRRWRRQIVKCNRTSGSAALHKSIRVNRSE